MSVESLLVGVSHFGVRMIELTDLWRTYQVGDSQVHALHGVDLTISRGDYVAVIGPSGSGKSTLLNILGCLDRPTSGNYVFDGRDVGQFTDLERTRLRQHEIGFVFQFFHLLARLTAQGNVELPMLFAGVARASIRPRALAVCAGRPKRWRRWGCRIVPITVPISSPEVSARGWPSPVPWSWVRASCSPMSPPATWTRHLRSRSWICSSP